MTLTLQQSVSAVAANVPAWFQAYGGFTPYVYSVVAGGAGGTINSSTGAYVAPSVASSSPNEAYDVIRVTDAHGATATASILVGTILILFCDILRMNLQIASERVYVWDQKINEPIDSGLFIAVSNPICKPYANINKSYDGIENQSVNMFATFDVDIISRGPEARDRKEEIILALKSTYSEQQQEINSFQIAQLTTRFVNLSNVDGAAIPYRYKISVNVLYATSKSRAIPYYDSFETPEIYTNP